MSLLSRLPVALVVALRAHGGRQRSLSLVTILAIAASVTLATGLEMSSRSVEAELERTARAVGGAAVLEVVSGSRGVPESTLEEVASVPGVAVAAPFVQATFRINSPQAEGAPIHVLGVDLLADLDVRSYAASATVSDPLRLIAGANAVIIGEDLAERLKLREGDPLSVRLGRRPIELAVRGILARKGVAEAYGGQVAVMDVYNLQALLGKEGWLDRIDVTIAPGSTKESVAAALAEKVKGRATVRTAKGREGLLESALQMVRLVVAALLVVAVMVSALVSYSALSLFIDRRLPELALLRAAGLEPRRVRRFLYLDAALLTVVGVLAGLLFGRILSQGFLAGLSRLSGLLEGIQLERLEMHVSTLMTAVVVGGLVAFAGVFAPAERATQRPPIDVLTGGLERNEGSRRTHPMRLLVPLLASFAAALLPSVPLLLRVAGAFAAGILSLVVLAGVALPHLVQRIGRLLDHLLPGVGLLAGASLMARPGQTRLALICVGGVVAGVTISLALTQSAARNLDDWIASMFPGGMMVMAGEIVGTQPEEPITPQTLQIIRETTGVRGVFDQVGEDIVYRGEDVLLFAGSMAVMGQLGRLPVVEGDPRAIADAVSRGEIIVSNGFSHHFGVRAGDEVTLDTPKGARTFKVAGVIRDYAGPAGSINMDASVFQQLWPTRGFRDLVVWTEGDPKPVIAEIRRRVGDSQPLFFIYGDDLAHFASGFIRDFQAILASVALLTAFLGGVAVWNLMVAAVTARNRELALLLATGATGRQIRTLTLVDGLILGLCGGVAGIGLGLAAGYPMVSTVMADALGWSLRFSLNIRDVALLFTGLALASLLASVYPARLAASVPIREASGAE
jgi:putative ABC transport system permease protein